MPKQPIEDRLRASVKFGAYQGDFMERGVCGNQMREAADTITALRTRIGELELERLRFYHADGTFEILASPEEVIQRRIACAQRLG